MNTPTLRFKEFKDDIVEKELGQLTSLVQSGLSRQLSDEDIGLPVLRSNNLLENKIDISDIKYWFLEDPQGANTKNYFLKNNDLLVNFINSLSQIGKSAIYTNELKREAILTTNILRLQFKENINPKYIGYFFQTKQYFDYIQSITKPAVNQASFTTKELAKLLVPISSYPEQNKIAEFLSAVDDKISQLSRQLELLNQYKKGVMQKIFSQEIRFKNDNGEDFGEWEEVPLNQIASKVTVKNRGNKVTEVLTNSATQGIIKQSDFFDREIVSESNINGYYIVEVDDFVYNPRISVHAPVGPIKRNKIIQGIMSPLYTVFRFKEGNLDFLSYFFETNFWHDYVKSVANSGARHDRMNITNSDFLEMPILLPSIQEQEIIAEFLTAIDERIDHTTAQLTHTKQWKKGILQQMFV